MQGRKTNPSFINSTLVMQMGAGSIAPSTIKLGIRWWSVAISTSGLLLSIGKGPFIHWVRPRKGPITILYDLERSFNSFPYRESNSIPERSSDRNLVEACEWLASSRDHCSLHCAQDGVLMDNAAAGWMFRYDKKSYSQQDMNRVLLEVGLTLRKKGFLSAILALA